MRREVKKRISAPPSRSETGLSLSAALHTPHHTTTSPDHTTHTTPHSLVHCSNVRFLLCCVFPTCSSWRSSTALSTPHCHVMSCPATPLLPLNHCGRGALVPGPTIRGPAMLRSLASGVSGLSGLADSLSPLYRTPDEQLAAAWRRASAVLQSSASSAHSVDGADVDVHWCSPALLRSLNQIIEALRRDTTYSARRTAVAGSSRPGQHTHAAPTVHSDSLSHSAPAAATASLDCTACVSYLLNECVLEQLCDLGVTDRPAGTRSLVVRCVEALLTCPHSSTLLLQSTVYCAVVRLLAASVERGEHRSKASRRTVLALCRTLCSHLAHSSTVAEKWLSAAPSVSSLCSAPSGCHLVCDVLLSMINFHGSIEGDICAAGLFDLACSQSTTVSQGALTDVLRAEYVNVLVGGVVELLAQLPPVSVSPSISTLLAENAAGRALSSRLQAIDALCLCASAPLVLQLCSDFRRRVLDGVLAPLVCDVREDVAGWATLLLCHIVKRTDSQSLTRTIAACLLAVSQQHTAALASDYTSCWAMSSSCAPIG